MKLSLSLLYLSLVRSQTGVVGTMANECARPAVQQIQPLREYSISFSSHSR